jgi:exopolysaccharide biosynthesis protein
MLVRDGKALAFSEQKREPRTAIGWNDKHFFFVVVDGRQNKLSVGMSFPELAAYFVKLGCQRAMNLDGGGSATFWVRGQVMNSPCYGHERPMANALVLVQKPKSPGAPRPDGPAQ